MSKLNGWARLWIVASLAIWAAGFVYMQAAAERMMPAHHFNVPPIFLSRTQICQADYETALSHASTCEQLRRLGDDCQWSLDTQENCISGVSYHRHDGRWMHLNEESAHDDHLLTRAIDARWQVFFTLAGRLWYSWLAPFALGVLFLGGRWIARELRPAA